MRCPKCGARIPHESPICFKCGTKLTQVREASFKAVKEAKKSYQPEKIVYSTIFPSDLSYKKTLLMCIFLGFFGGHYFYTQRLTRGIISLVFGLFFFACILIPGFIVGFKYDFTLIMQTFYAGTALNALFVVACIGGAVLLGLWILDIIKLSIKKFKVPVVLKEK